MTEPHDRLTQISELAARWQKLMQDKLQQQASGAPQVQIPDPQSVQHAFEALWRVVLEKPEPMLRAQMQFWMDYADMAQAAMRQFWLGGPAQSVAQPDKRFKDELWVNNQVFGFVKQAYLLASRHIQDSVSGVDGLDEHTAQRVQFYTRQFVDAMAPTNFLATNPVALKATLESGGENLIKGFAHLLEDLERNGGRMMPRMTDLDAFTLGENVATTPGKVVFQNELMQLIQYAPLTEKVHKTPLLVVPPWINKFYILDLKPKNSLIRWLVEQGHTVFVISWVNPDGRHRDKGFEHYMTEGTLAALDAIQAATGEKQINAAAYCIGGTLLSATLAWMAAAKDKRYPPNRIKSAAFFTTMIDFSEPGELGVFIDEEQLGSLDAYMEEKGYLEGHQMAGVFNLLRENDLIWSFVINNYLLGREPMPFDLLYWNCDSTRMPAAMHRFYLRKMYLENVLKDPGGVTLAGVPIDMRAIKTPAYFISAREDHIAPWQSTYAGARLLQGPVRFVLGGSGHIAGIVNPPSANKYGYATNAALPTTPQQWLADSSAHEGSWWLDWAQWVLPHQGKPVAARQPGAGGLPAIEDAPGSYVKAKL
ncbi:class I poly(R)-hydroxyalkanoic acid synthase [Chitinimonas viridis]|uniref:Class I poly(R)-hydroxyalkanoic acid synthase n=1 Tax=Chitinimonas viridis TaxID=664880 RepID=A0ABT8B7R1_9NEIS|nr:class I poly(R)-hydroxyalkanoic acid synthase [Chitinimonas viridis]MDN3577651.1 class I poly(R)-hydroxyalkanoic acid synthase [Chitinimonas viridis]